MRRNLIIGVFREFQHILRSFNPSGADIGAYGSAGFFFEQFGEIGFTQTDAFGNAFDRKRLMQIIIYVINYPDNIFGVNIYFLHLFHPLAIVHRHSVL